MTAAPVLFLNFNRPEHTRRAFEQIRRAQPARLYVHIDGPRSSRAADRQLCDEVAHTFSSVDWPCQLNILQQNENLGCRRAVSTALAWFFSYEVEGIILEDDIIPSSTFFSYCEELLERYREDPRVFMISGCNMVGAGRGSEVSYLFSQYMFIWGWATWRRSWERYDVDMAAWRNGVAPKMLKTRFRDKLSQWYYWQNIFTKTCSGIIDTWDYQWLLSGWLSEAVGIFPTTNLVENIGFGGDATHTIGKAPDHIAAARAKELRFPLVHPVTVATDVETEVYIERREYRTTWRTYLKALAWKLSGERLLL